MNMLNSVATFLPFDAALPGGVDIRSALLFAFEDSKFVVADIEGRGWCIPGGHLEKDETAEIAVRREAYEEAGTVVGELGILGSYLFKPVSGTPYLVPAYFAEVLTRETPPAGFESRGVELFELWELPSRYFHWDALMEAVFQFALMMHLNRSEDLSSTAP